MKIIRQLQTPFRFTFILAVVFPIVAYAAYIGLRPITNGKVNQCYLYGEVCPPDAMYPHKGIDFSAAMGTEVGAIANGRVVALRENIDDNTHPSESPFGNYVLIRHEQQHWVRQNNGQAVGQWGYVYSLYAHLKQNSVIPVLQGWVNAGTKIAEVDNTGNSGGNHLHLQIIVHQSQNPQMASNGIDLSQGWTESSSRNPELWMAAFNNGATQTGTAVGVVTDTNGNPVAGLKITGVQKPGSATHGTYDYSETYDATNENPDDLLVENFATTDVASGTYHLYAYKISDGSLYRYLGWHTFEAGRTTYVGLSPNYLPNVDNLGAQTSTITVRNNNGSRTARANTTFLWYSGTVHSQQQNSIAPNATLTISAPTNFFGSALVVGSDDLSVAVETIYNDGGRHLADMYPGVTSSRISTAMYAPLILRNWPHLNSSWRQTTDLYIFNPSSQAASVTATFYDSYGTTDPPHVELRTIPAGGVVTIPGTELPTWEGGSISGSLASARITSNVPVAVVVRNWVGTSTLGSITTPYLSSSYRGFAASEADSTVYFPLAANQWVGAYDSGFQIQNISSSPKTVTVRFYKEGDPNPQGSAVNLTIGAYQCQMPPDSVPGMFTQNVPTVCGQRVPGSVTRAATIYTTIYRRVDDSTRYGRSAQ